MHFNQDLEWRCTICIKYCQISHLSPSDKLMLNKFNDAQVMEIVFYSLITSDR